MARELTEVVFFLLIGYLTTYFSKNMIIVLLVAMLLTNFFAVSRNINNNKFVENFDEKEEKNNNSTIARDDNATLNSMVENLSKNMDSPEIEAMEQASHRLIDKQKKLKKDLIDITPNLEKNVELLNKMGGIKGIETMIDKVEGMLNKFGGKGGLLGGQ